MSNAERLEQIRQGVDVIRKRPWEGGSPYANIWWMAEVVDELLAQLATARAELERMQGIEEAYGKLIFSPLAEQLEEARAELERMRRIINDEAGLSDYHASRATLNFYEEKLAKEDAENHRLREALTNLLGWARAESVVRQGHADSEVAQGLFAQAQAALAPEEPNRA